MIEDVVSQISFPGITFEVIREGRHVFLRVACLDGRDTRTGQPMPWWGRKWRLSDRMEDGEVVATALKAVLTALEHEAREQFKFMGQAVFDPHYDIHLLVALRAKMGAITERAG